MTLMSCDQSYCSQSKCKSQSLDFRRLLSTTTNINNSDITNFNSDNNNIAKTKNIFKSEHSTIMLPATDSTSQDLVDSESITTTGTEQLKMFEILPNLYMSKFPAYIPLEITHVLNMCTHRHPPDPSRAYLHISLDDIDNIKPHIPQILEYIDNALQNNGKILVHCALGINRSAAAIVSYLCHRNRTNSSAALEFLKEKKGDVKPSALFLKQIDQFFHREEEKEDPLVGFHRRLQQRRQGALIEKENR
jgi:protein-tyrosine phosphatase